MKNRILTLCMVLGMVGLLVGCSKLTKMNDEYYKCSIQTEQETVTDIINDKEVNLFTKDVQNIVFEEKEELNNLIEILDTMLNGYAEFCDDFKDSCRENYEYVEHITEEGDETIPFFTSRKVEQVENTKDLVSIKFEVSGYWGGAHGFSYIDTVNYSPELGREIEIEDVIDTTQDDWKDKLTEVVFNICENRTVLDEPISYFENYKNDLATAFDSNYFYLTKDAIVFVYGEYGITPYSEGIQEVEVPFSEIQDLVTPAYKIVK